MQLILTRTKFHINRIVFRPIIAQRFEFRSTDLVDVNLQQVNEMNCGFETENLWSNFLHWLDLDHERSDATDTLHSVTI